MDMFKNEVEELQARIDKLGIYEMTINYLEDKMKWAVMKWHDKDDDHDTAWFTDPDVDDYEYNRFLAYKDIIESLKKDAHSLTKR